MDSEHDSEADSDEQYGSESSDSEPAFTPLHSFFERADNASVKKLNLPPSSESLLKFRAPTDICQTCRRMLQLISNVVATGSRFDGKYHENYAAVKSSAQNGCGICSMLLREFRIELKERDKSGKTRKTASLHAIGSSFSWNVAIPWMDGDPTPGVTHMEPCDAENYYCLAASIESFVAGSQSLDYDSPAPNTRDALAMCKIWFQNCRDAHKTCGLPQVFSDEASPTAARLIAVSNGDARLCLPEELSPNSPYAALSHRWGFLNFMTLKKDNIDTFRKQIPAEALTKTFRDAIDICRYLDIPYLWIDSLCIIQDSAEDWAQQSALMAQIYGQCDLNIAATSAEDGTVGCFFDRPKNWAIQIRPLPERDDVIYDFMTSPLIHPELDVLNNRGWVVQERYLSRRTLHFTAKQVFWECDGESACETCPGGYPQRASSFCPYELKRRGMDRSNWDDLVSQYSGARLTQSSDRLIAVEGLARSIQATTKDEYVAGMWREWIERQLAWSPSEDFRPIPNTTCPSWSWASGIGGVSLPLVWFDGTSNSTTHITLHDLQVQYFSTNTFRDVKSAVIRLRCSYLFRAILEPVGDSPDVYYKAKIGDETFDEVYLKIDNPDVANKAQPISAYILIIDESRGILLEPTGEANGQYRRIGSMFTLQSSFIEPLGFVNCVEQRQLDAFSAVEEDDEGNEVYVIDV
ncbi:heterokaryon incompatibility domain-containing protein, partial [Trichoderma sp. TUCIM 5745]